MKRRKPNPTSRVELGHFHVSEFVLLALLLLLVAGVLAAAAGILLGFWPLTALPIGARQGILGTASLGIFCMLYAHFVEPKKLTVQQVDIQNSKIGPQPVRLLHISDIHVNAWGRMEDQIVARAKELSPDLVLITGDLGGTDPVAENIRRLLRELSAVAPTFVSLGNHEYRKPPLEELIMGSDAHWLLNETVARDIRGTHLRITGVNAGEEEAVYRLAPGEGGFNICMYHYPDLVPKLDEVPHDLMLCGHTHGGQVRLPLIGPIVTFAASGRPYACGLFMAGEKAAFITQGIGHDCYGFPSVRFLCPPEVVLITLTSSHGALLGRS